MPLRHSCRAVRSETGKPRGRIQGRYPNEERRILDKILL